MPLRDEFLRSHLYEASKLQSAVKRICLAPRKHLKSIEFKAACIRCVGWSMTRDTLWCGYRFMNSGPFGLWQILIQLARCVVELSNYNIGSMIEIGKWSGWAITFLGAYLRRFNPELHITTVDIRNCWGSAQRLTIPLRVPPLACALPALRPRRSHAGSTLRIRGIGERGTIYQDNYSSS